MRGLPDRCRPPPPQRRTVTHAVGQQTAQQVTRDDGGRTVIERGRQWEDFRSADACPVTVEGDLREDVGQLLAHTHRRRSARRRTGGERSGNREHSTHVRGQIFADRGEVGIADLLESNVMRQTPDDEMTNGLVSVAEGDALSDQELGHVRCKAEAGRVRPPPDGRRAPAWWPPSP